MARHNRCMKYVWIVVVAIAGALLAEDAKQPEGPTAEQKLQALKWVSGSWSGKMWGGEFHAYYSTPDGGKILSHSYLKKGGKQSFYEFEKFDVQKGQVVYIPFPGGRRAKHFLLTESGRMRAVFDNPEKDYPTRITFERDENLLEITLSDPHNKSPKKEVFRLQRQK